MRGDAHGRGGMRGTDGEKEPGAGMAWVGGCRTGGGRLLFDRFGTGMPTPPKRCDNARRVASLGNECLYRLPKK